MQDCARLVQDTAIRAQQHKQWRQEQEGEFVHLAQIVEQVVAEAPDNSVARGIGRHVLKRLGQLREGEATAAALAGADTSAPAAWNNSSNDNNSNSGSNNSGKSRLG